MFRKLAALRLILVRFSSHSTYDEAKEVIHPGSPCHREPCHRVSAFEASSELKSMMLLRFASYIMLCNSLATRD